MKFQKQNVWLRRSSSNHANGSIQMGERSKNPDVVHNDRQEYCSSINITSRVMRFNDRRATTGIELYQHRTRINVIGCAGNDIYEHSNHGETDQITPEPTCESIPGFNLHGPV